jgi:hypothetical protein
MAMWGKTDLHGCVVAAHFTSQLSHLRLGEWTVRNDPKPVVYQPRPRTIFFQ